MKRRNIIVDSKGDNGNVGSNAAKNADNQQHEKQNRHKKCKKRRKIHEDRPFVCRYARFTRVGSRSSPINLHYCLLADELPV
jgi:hypothetical protein